MRRTHRRVPRSTALACAAAVLTAVLTGCGGDSEAAGGSEAARTFPAGSTMHRIQQRGQLIVGVKYDQPSFGMLNPLTGKPEGFDIEIAEMIAKDLTGSEKNIRYVETVTANREAFIQQGKVDMVLATYVATESRMRQVGFAGPYYDTGVSIMTRKGDRSVRDADDLNDRPVCVAQGSQSAEVVPELAPRARLSEFSSYSYCAQALKDGRVDAMVTSESILIGLEQQNPDDLAVVPGHLKPEEVAVGFRKDDGGLRRYLRSFLTGITEDGRWTRAYRDTVGKVVQDSPKPPRILL